MQPASPEGAPGVKADPRRSRRDNLALVYQGFLTGIVRLQARRQQLGDAEVFRKRMQDALRDAARDATTLGYSSDDIRDAEFAIVAFLDEVILRSDDPSREQWAKHTLGVDRFGEASAGDVFFERLEDFKKRSNNPHFADLAEVYLLCLLLGFEGRHAGNRGELHAHIDWLKRRIDGTRRLEPRITPEAVPPQFASGPVQRVRSAGPDKRWQTVILIAACASVLLFALLKLSLWPTVNTIRAMVQG